MKRYLMIFVSALMAGFCITFGATCYLVCASNGGYALKVAGAFLFGIGLFTIIHFGFWLYTGKVGYALDNKPKYIIDLLICLCGNLIGVFILSLILKQTHIITNSVIELAKSMVETKQDETWYEVFILASLCGIMIYLAVVGHAKCEYTIGKVLFAYLPIVLFILCGFEHVVANMTYYVYAGYFEAKMILWFFIMALGNAFGAIAFDGIIKLINYLKKDNNNNNTL